MPIVQNIAWVGKTSQLVTVGPAATPDRSVRVMRHLFDAPKVVSLDLTTEISDAGTGGTLMLNAPSVARYRIVWGVQGSQHEVTIDAVDASVTLVADAVDVSLLVPGGGVIGGLGTNSRSWRTSASCCEGSVKGHSPTLTHNYYALGAGNNTGNQIVPKRATHFRLLCDDPAQEPNVRILGYAPGTLVSSAPRAGGGIWPQNLSHYIAYNDDPAATDLAVVWTIGL